MSAERFDWRLERALRDGQPPPPGTSPSALERLAQSDQEVLAQYPPEQMARRMRQKLEAGRGRKHWAFSGGIGVALAACALVLFLRSPDTRAPAVGEESIRLKGAGATRCGTCGRSEPHLHLFEERGGHSELAPDGTLAQAGDHVQLGYHASGSQGVIVSIDGRGGVTLHWPAQEGAASRLEPGDHLLPQGFELDDAPGFERFFLVTGDAVAVPEVLAAARRLAAQPDALHAPLPLRPGLGQSTVLLRKPAPAAPR